MQYQSLGKSALKVSRLCLGTMNFGPRTSEEDSFAVLNAAVDAGINFIDTANQYGGHLGVGTTESILGSWLAEDSSRRDKLIIATKVHEPMSDDINDRGLSARHIQMACDASLKRLGIDHIDLYQMVVSFEIVRTYSNVLVHFHKKEKKFYYRHNKKNLCCQDEDLQIFSQANVRQD